MFILFISQCQAVSFIVECFLKVGILFTFSKGRCICNNNSGIVIFVQLNQCDWNVITYFFESWTSWLIYCQASTCIKIWLLNSSVICFIILSFWLICYCDCWGIWVAVNPSIYRFYFSLFSSISIFDFLSTSLDD